MSDAKEYLVVNDAVDLAAVSAMRAWAASSIHVGDSPLKGTFSASRGFAITFTPEGLSTIAQRFPELWPYFTLAVTQRPWLPLFGRIERLRWALAGRAVRAFYFNLLSVPGGAGVGVHIDATLSELVGEVGVTPLVVSVLYLSAPPGGALKLWRGKHSVAEIVPKPGMLVCFRGDLGHEVATVDSDMQRLSLVCEQYALAKSAAARIPTMKVTSRGLFERVRERNA